MRAAYAGYGKLYEAILLAKLALFAVMVHAGVVLLARTPQRWAVEGDARSLRGHVAGRLGLSGMLFVLCAPAIVGAVVALRYVHILSHVAEAGGAG